MYLDFLGWLPTAPSCIETDVEVSKGLCLSVVRFESVIAREDLVEVNISIKEDIVP